jgi:hypothetical protein
VIASRTVEGCTVDDMTGDAENIEASDGTLMLAAIFGTIAGETVGVTPTGKTVVEEQSGGDVDLKCV